jgi:K+-sensing histidine kinase KdpD
MVSRSSLTAVWRQLSTYVEVGPPPYVVALGTSALAGLAAWLLAPLDWDNDNSVAALLFLTAVSVAGWYGGLRPALVATACGALLLDYFFENPPNTLVVTSSHTVVDLLSFLIVASLLGSLNARLRWSHARLRAERDRAEAALAARDELMASVSHELRTPLTAIKASVFSLRDQATRLSPTTRVRLLGTIEAEADRLIHIVTEALALRRLENGLAPRWEWTAPSEVASAVLDRCLPALGARPVSFAIPDDLPPVRMDPSLLDQALSGLLENVATHTPPGSAVAIEGGIHNGDLRLAISDAGPGVPPDARERIFSKYVRLLDTTPGIGLGLAIARAAVEAQGGRLWVEDSDLGGARFVVSIPRTAVEGRTG